MEALEDGVVVTVIHSVGAEVGVIALADVVEDGCMLGVLAVAFAVGGDPVEFAALGLDDGAFEVGMGGDEFVVF